MTGVYKQGLTTVNEIVADRIERIIRISILPSGMLLAAILLLTLPVSIRSEITESVPYLPFIAAGTSLVLSLLFNQSKVTFISLNLLLIAALLPELNGFGYRSLTELVISFGISNFALFGTLENRGVFSKYGFILCSLFAFESLLILGIQHSIPERVSEIMKSPLLGFTPLIHVHVPDLILVLILSSTVILILRLVLRPGHVEASLLFSLLAFCLAVNWAESIYPWPLLISTGGFILCSGVLLNSIDMAFRDELTGLPSRRSLEQFLRTLGRKYSIAMIDIDHFKRVNDNYGHEVGDQVLRFVGSRISKVGNGGKAFRYGGEEFTVLFPGKELHQVEPFLEALRKEIENYRMVLRTSSRLATPRIRKYKVTKSRKPGGRKGKQMVSVTVSLGVAIRDEQNKTPAEVISAADRALYLAKKSGRNRLCY